MTTTLNASNSGSGGLVATADASGVLALQTAGTTAVTVDASQNVGIGTSSPSAKLELGSGTLLLPNNVFIQQKDSSGNAKNVAGVNSSNQYSFGGLDGSSTVNTIRALVAGNEAMRIDSSGNVGIGTTSPNGKLEIKAASASQRQLQLTHFNSTDGWYFTADDTGGALRTSRAGSTGLNGEAMRIDSSGNVLVGTTSTSVTSGGYNFLINDGGTGYSTGYIGHITGCPSGYAYLSFKYAGTAIGTITQNGTTAVAYNTSSDYRLKNTIAPMTGALAKVALLKPCTYKWNSDGSDGQGFIAHELDEVVPGCVTGEKDAVDTDGNPVYQGIDTSFLVATLTAAIQEQQALITSLTARIAALEGTPA